MHTSPSGKNYIGITCKKPEYRWNNGNGYKSNKYFWHSIQKYGWSAFSHKILYQDLSELEAKQIEIKLIHDMKTSDRQYGYNITLGGESSTGRTTGHIPTIETRQKLSKALKGKKIHLGIKHSNETKKKLSQIMTGRPHSAATIDMMRKNSYNKKRVYQYDKNNNVISVFNSTQEAERMTGVCSTNISKCCRGVLNSTGGYVWRYDEEHN